MSACLSYKTIGRWSTSLILVCFSVMRFFVVAPCLPLLGTSHVVPRLQRLGALTDRFPFILRFGLRGLPGSAFGEYNESQT
jgi:hypothetical protein